jgi:hypothetical protein
VIKLKKLLKEKVYSIDTSKNPNIIIGDLYDSLFQFQKKISKNVLGPKGQKLLKKIVIDMNTLRGIMMMGKDK